METKRCSKCKTIKDESLFALNRGKRRATCRDCIALYNKEWNKKNFDRQRRSHLKNTYGLSWEEFEALVEKQNGKCAVCKIQTVTTEVRPRSEVSAVDHDHLTGKVRGILCLPCNLLLGYAKDDVVILQQAIDYLKEA